MPALPTLREPSSWRKNAETQRLATIARPPSLVNCVRLGIRRKNRSVTKKTRIVLSIASIAATQCGKPTLPHTLNAPVLVSAAIGFEERA